ncbi:MAG: SUMF1/EgtB/PvdO family nonheme iron enzyme, partial [Epsilonproteobacteria bacterium]|nr:SUMF1/EgtB/PvdO family nonheme iron enzyme [Campylobacterota bacterium]
WAVEVNYLEALAFCKWKSSKIGKKITLPSEAMWHRLHKVSGLSDEPNWGKIAPANINLEHYCSPCPINEFKHGDFYDVIGNVWQWTTTTIDGFTGFEIHPMYDDFSVPTFDRRHNIIKGGSFISTGNEALLSSRYAFRRHFFQHAGFRYVEVSSDHKEDIEVVKEEITFREVEFFDRVAHIAKKHIKDDFKSALNLGCDYGKSAFELASFFESIIGIDFTARNILIAQKNFELQDCENIAFWQGDSCNLKPHFKGFDFILLTNNFEEIYNITHLLLDIQTRLNEGGRIIIAFRNSTQKEQLKNILKEKLQLIDETEFCTVWEK